MDPRTAALLARRPPRGWVRWVLSLWADGAVVLGVCCLAYESWGVDEPGMMAGAGLVTIGALALIKQTLRAGDPRTLLLVIAVALAGLIYATRPSALDYSFEVAELHDDVDQVRSTVSDMHSELSNVLSNVESDLSTVESRLRSIELTANVIEAQTNVIETQTR